MPTIPPEKLVLGVRPVGGEALVYWVQSSSNPEQEYRVDLKMYCGNGWCGCPDFEIRKQPKLEARSYPSVSLECKHIARARRYWGFVRLNAEIELMEDDADEIRTQNKARRLDGRKWGEASPKPPERAKGKAVAPPDYAESDDAVTPVGEETPF